MNLNNLKGPIRIGIDTGGTFTDYVIVSNTGEICAWKVPTTPADPSVGIIEGLKETMKIFHFQASDVDLIVHGTTIGTNAFLEDKCPPVAFLTTKGFQDIVEIGRQQRSELYNFKFGEKYPISFSKDILFEVNERLDRDGKVIRPLNMSNLDALVSELKINSIQTVAVSLLFSFLNPQNEKSISSFFNDKNIQVFPSHEISPQIKEYERAVTTLVNAKVSPVVHTYLRKLEKQLKEIDIKAPLLIMQSNTGMADVKTIGRSGIQTLYSGLAGGVLAAADSLKHLSRTHLVSLDIGGTSTDVSALIDQPIILRSRNFGGFPLIASMVDVETIGSGGGSIAKFKDGLLSVGPESQGANPGPACYSLGGDKVTLTDANLFLGYVHEDNFAGNMNIDNGKSKLYLMELLDEINSSTYSLEIESVDELALSIRKILNNNIANAIRVVTIQRGLDPRNFALLGFGGAGPLQSWEIAKELEMGGVIIPPFPGVWSAFGLVSSDIKHEVTQSYLQATNEVDFADINEKMLDIKERLAKVLTKEDVEEEQRAFNYSVDMRCMGQSDSLTISAAYPLNKATLAELIENFHSLHNQSYSWIDRDLTVELVNISVEAVGYVPRITMTKLPVGTDRPPKEARKTSRKVNFDGYWLDTPVYNKALLLSGNVVEGPCIIDQLDTTTIIPPKVIGKINSLGYIIMEEKK